MLRSYLQSQYSGQFLRQRLKPAFYRWSFKSVQTVAISHAKFLEDGIFLEGASLAPLLDARLR
jgi:hypothetical protein